MLAFRSGEAAMIVALPKFKDNIAPCFEVAHWFLIVRSDGIREISRRLEECCGCEGFGRIELLRAEKTDVLICNGIKIFYADLLRASGMVVYQDVCETIDNALNLFFQDRLVGGPGNSNHIHGPDSVPLSDLVCWTREYFTSHGYTVYDGNERALFPVDLVAEIRCPRCGKPVRVAICCGAHTYRSNQEIRQLYRVTSIDYHARVYIHPATPEIQRCCREYNIELIDPSEEITNTDLHEPDRIPILRNLVEDHEKASGEMTRKRSPGHVQENG